MSQYSTDTLGPKFIRGPKTGIAKQRWEDLAALLKSMSRCLPLLEKTDVKFGYSGSTREEAKTSAQSTSKTEAQKL